MRFSGYSKKSSLVLTGCDLQLQFLFKEVIRGFDVSLTSGHRGKSQQYDLYKAGKSHLIWPTSRHNQDPSLAIDVCPYPWDFEVEDLKKLHYMAGFIKGVACRMNIGLRWGGDWDMDNDFSDHTFYDLYHFELTRKITV